MLDIKQIQQQEFIPFPVERRLILKKGTLVLLLTVSPFRMKNKFDKLNTGENKDQVLWSDLNYFINCNNSRQVSDIYSPPPPSPSFRMSGEALQHPVKIK